MEKVVFLDRDGVINKKAPPHEYITRWEDFIFLPGTVEALRMLHDAGYRLIVVTNQQCIYKEIATEEQVRELHRKMCTALTLQGTIIDAVFVCPHGEEENCSCRKPKPGLLQMAERLYKIDKAQSFMIGDSVSDIQAGEAYGVRTILVNNNVDTCGDIQCADLSEAAAWILK